MKIIYASDSMMAHQIMLKLSYLLYSNIIMTHYLNTPLTTANLGNNVPRRHGKFTQKLAKNFNRMVGWRIVGEVANLKKAVLIGAPHTSNFDGVYTLPLLIELDIDIKILGKKELFTIPILSHFLKWAGVIAIDRQKKGSTLKASVDKFHTSERLFLALAPEGTRSYTDTWKTGFYYLALEAGVPIIPVALDYKTREIRFMTAFYPTGDIEADLPKLYAYYQGVQGKNHKNMSKPLQDLFHT
ncbi:lysophospholipid acyltransferase family protein [Moraxella oblonga]|uniref:lysophospholipid acyltransferase family protein n=1 Tax=Moraxella oblonga TaxID=200413 RepID=UPI000AC71E7D|nr:lysophospholipid acyltransferase family protein [Moraxella oblonga]